MRSVVALLGVACLAVAGCGERPNDAIPSARELASAPPDELERRFAAIDARIRSSGLDDASLVERALAGHAAVAAFERTHDVRFSRRARRWLGTVAIDGSPSGPACRATLDLARLDRALGDLEGAGRRADEALAAAVGDLACRDELRALASAAGRTIGSPAIGEAPSARITSVEVLGAPGDDVAGIRVVVSLDADARGELYPTVDVASSRVARLRFGSASFAEGIAFERVGRGGLDRIVAAASGLDLVLERGAEVRASVVHQPTRWILDVDRAELPGADDAEAPPVIVLDPGHGGDEHGARVDGVRESQLVLDIATRTAATLAVLVPRSRIVLTRTTDDEVSLEQRAALANSLDADLFVSIHLNDADVPVITGGITTFVLDTEDDRQARRLAARENATTTDRVSGLAVLLAGLHRESQVGESRRLASFVHTATLARARETLPRIPDRGVKAAGYYVLVGTRMPSVLVECSFMTRPEELTALRTQAYRESLAQGIARGIADYLGSR